MLEIEVAGSIYKPRFGGLAARLFGSRERRVDTFAASWRAPGPSVVRAFDHRSGVRVRVTTYASGRVKLTLWWREVSILDWEDSWVRPDGERTVPFQATVGLRIQGTVTLRWTD